MMTNAEVVKTGHHVEIKLGMSTYLMDNDQYAELLHAIRLNPPEDVVWLSLLTKGDTGHLSGSDIEELTEELNDAVASVATELGVY